MEALCTRALVHEFMLEEQKANTDAENENRDSAEMLQLAWRQVREQGWRLVNLDCVVHLQRPKLSPYKQMIQDRIAEILEVDAGQIGPKAKTGELVGPVGSEQAGAAQCVALLEAVESRESAD